MRLSRTFARIVVHHRHALFGAVALLVILAVLVIGWRVRFASDVLDLLPQHFEAVQAFKTFDREFSQARELTFGLLDETGTVDLDAFTEHFATALRAEPWVERVMDRSPMESPDGLEGVRILALPLLLNLAPEDFDRALQKLAPEQMAARLGKLRAGLEAGSPKAEFELESDPLGLIAPALLPLSKSFSIEQTRPLVSPDGTLRIVLVKTNQPDLGAAACQAIMRQVEDFQRRVVEEWSGPAPQILVTGRTPYVGELSLTMRGDVLSTVASSIGLVTLLFFVGFRRLRPLVAIVAVLVVSCILSVAFGAVALGELNIITIGLCAILIGLGVDCGMMYYGVYAQERGHGATHEDAIATAIHDHGWGVFFGALTTAVAFLCFLRSQSTGFEQLGVLIAVGILAVGIFMTTLFFALLGRRCQPPASDWLWRAGQRFVASVWRAPRAYFLIAATILVASAIFALAPVGRLQFDANPKSLEPPHSRAGTALRTIQAKMPIAAEPVIVLLQNPSAEGLHAGWNKLQTAWSELVAQKQIRGAASPAALALSPARMEANAARLAQFDFDASRTALRDTLAREELSADSFGAAFALLDALHTVGRGERGGLDWRAALPENSSWWFVLDRFFSRDPHLGAAYITPLKTLTTFAEKEQLRAALEATGVPIQISGWSYTLQDLVPWARGKLFELSAIMIALNALLLAVLYRRLFPLFLLLLSLALAIGALVTSLKLFGIPLNMFNVLAFPLVLGVGVDYGIYVALAMRHAGDPQRNLATVVKPVLLSGLTTACGFASLGLAANPALRGLGLVCALGVAWCLVTTLCFLLPAYAWREAKEEVRS